MNGQVCVEPKELERLINENENLRRKYEGVRFILMECRNALSQLEAYDDRFYSRTCPGLLDQIKNALK